MSTVTLWENIYQQTLGDVQSYKTRLKELETWDKPLCPKSKDPHLKWREWAFKQTALEGLISECK